MAIDYLAALGAGSGINTQEVVSALVEAERAPKQTALDRNIERSEAKVSGYGLLKSALSQLQDSFGQLREADDLQGLTIAASGTVGFDATVSNEAEVGRFDLKVVSLADNDGWGSSRFSTVDQSLNLGNVIELTVTGSSGASQISVTDPTPENIVDAINASDLGLTAQILNVGGTDPYRITVYGDQGSDQYFGITSDSVDLDFNERLSTAQDAEIEVNGLSIIRSTNSFDDVIDGVSITVFSEMDQSEIVEVSKDSSELRSRLLSFVEVYNNVESELRRLYMPSEDALETDGSLNGDSLTRSIATTVRRFVTDESGSASGDIAYMSDLGISIDRYGKLNLDETLLDTVLDESLDDVVTMLTNNTNGTAVSGSVGLAGDAYTTLEEILNTSGDVERRIDLEQNQISGYQDELDKLDKRMDQIRARYISQFSAMQSIVDQMNSTREYLKQQFEALNQNND